jgi:hypothetical protein
MTSSRRGTEHRLIFDLPVGSSPIPSYMTAVATGVLFLPLCAAPGPCLPGLSERAGAYFSDETFVRKQFLFLGAGLAFGLAWDPAHVRPGRLGLPGW